MLQATHTHVSKQLTRQKYLLPNYLVNHHCFSKIYFTVKIFYHAIFIYCKKYFVSHHCFSNYFYCKIDSLSNHCFKIFLNYFQNFTKTQNFQYINYFVNHHCEIIFEYWDSKYFLCVVRKFVTKKSQRATNWLGLFSLRKFLTKKSQRVTQAHKINCMYVTLQLKIFLF